VIPARNTQANAELARTAYWSVAIFNANEASNTNSPPPPITSDLFYLTDFATRPVTEAVFVVVEGRGLNSSGPGSAAPAAYRISVWRVVLHSPNDNSTANTIPHKET
jgi:hypothetical protein